TAMASLTGECAHPLANHRLECTLDAIRGVACGVESRRGSLACLTVGAENLLHGTLAEPERLRHPPHGVLRGDRWPLATFVIEIFLQLHDNLTFPPINSLALRHRVISWSASMRHSCETTISGYTTCLFGAKSCETRYSKDGRGALTQGLLRLGVSGAGGGRGGSGGGMGIRVRVWRHRGGLRRASPGAGRGAKGLGRRARRSVDGRSACVWKKGWAGCPSCHGPVRDAKHWKPGDHSHPSGPSAQKSRGGPRPKRVAGGMGPASSGLRRARTALGG